MSELCRAAEMSELCRALPSGGNVRTLPNSAEPQHRRPRPPRVWVPEFHSSHCSSQSPEFQNVPVADDRRRGLRQGDHTLGFGGSRFWPDLRQGDHAFGRICGRGMPTRAAALALWAALTVAAADAKIYGRCELAGNLVRAGLDGFGGFAVGDWLCVAHAESGFDTATVGHHPDGSGAYGLFGLSSAWWCHDGVTPTHDLCHLRCDDLLNRHLLDDIACIKKVVTLHRSMDAWNSWSQRCKGHDPSLWLRGCALRPRDPWPR
ncbi:sperm acrosome-associated protein 5-like [Microtus pennsylvanicus]|uniref:sperm acrosome-associated protein 5-like n=1 Tax=Microtus pennsylvanicus TaxID=10058 RepID=UPI003F6C0178